MGALVERRLDGGDGIPTWAWGGMAIRVVTSIFALVAFLQAAYLLYAQPWGGLLDGLFHLLVSGTAFLGAPVALLLAWRPRPGSPATRRAALLASVVPLTWSSFFVLVVGQSWGAGGPPLAGWMRASGWIFLGTPWVGLGAFLSFSAIFPVDLRDRPGPAPGTTSRRIPPSVTALRRLSKRSAALWGWALLVPLALVSAAAMALFLIPSMAEELVLFVAAVTCFALLGWFVLWVTAGVLNLEAGLRLAGEAVRRRALWTVLGFVVAGWLLVASVLLGLLDLLDVLPEISDLWTVAPSLVAPLAVILGLYLAVFYTGALDPEGAIRRTTLNGTVAVVLALLFAGVETAMEGVLAALTAAEGLGVWVAGAVVALAFAPVQAGVKRRLDAWLD